MMFAGTSGVDSHTLAQQPMMIGYIYKYRNASRTGDESRARSIVKGVALFRRVGNISRRISR